MSRDLEARQGRLSFARGRGGAGKEGRSWRTVKGKSGGGEGGPGEEMGKVIVVVVGEIKGREGSWENVASIKDRFIGNGVSMQWVRRFHVLCVHFAFSAVEHLSERMRQVF